MKNKSCVHPECSTRAYFNTKGEDKPLYCNKHKLDGMIDVLNKKCKGDGCEMIPHFNYPEEKGGIYCRYHALEGMKDVVTKRCIHEGCDKFRRYNYENEKLPLYCKEHSKLNMVDVKTRRCNHPECKKIPSFNYVGKKIGLYCSNHALDNMINVHHKECIEENCNTRPGYNFPGEKKMIYCAKHKLPGMISLKHRYCQYENCKKQPNYNNKGEKKPLYCAEHKSTGMVSIYGKMCKNDWCDTLIKNNKNEGYCLFCYVNMFPDRAITRNYKTKESCVVKYVKDTYEEYDWIADKKIEGGCSKRRPDLMLDLGYQVVIIEVDENQHTDYDCSCENKRLMEISQDLGHRPIVFIRFNPDDYKNKEGEKITSCWGINKLGICSIKKTKQKQWEKRLENLNNQIKYWIENKTEKTVEVVQLYYDEN
jgi:hypothetical protein